MFDGLVLILAAWVAITTVILAVLIRNFSNPYVRILLPLLCGAVLSAIFFSPLVFPLLIVSALFIVEWRAGGRIGVAGILSGSFITLVVFWGIQKYSPGRIRFWNTGVRIIMPISCIMPDNAADMTQTKHFGGYTA